VIFILENNQYSVCSHISVRQAGDNIFHMMPSRLLMTNIVNGNDVLHVYDSVNKAVARARMGQGPSFIECRTYRIRGHAGCESQDIACYRPVEEIEYGKRLCPVAAFQKKLLKKKLITLNEIKKMAKKIDGQIKDAFAFARQAPNPAQETLPFYLFHE
jgi:TPP-dependent pyruvate/acetoin dehydrogenase alpha subunit